jgi:hypothetical protein
MHNDKLDLHAIMDKLTAEGGHYADALRDLAEEARKQPSTPSPRL